MNQNRASLSEMSDDDVFNEALNDLLRQRLLVRRLVNGNMPEAIRKPCERRAGWNPTTIPDPQTSPVIVGGITYSGCSRTYMYKNGGFCSSEARSNGCRLILVRLQRLVEDSLQSHACVALQ